MANELILRPVSPFNDKVKELVEKLDAYQKGHYPPASNHLDAPEVFLSSRSHFLGAYQDGELIGTAAVKLVSEANGANVGESRFGELKRFYLKESHRGQGIAECLVAVLEKWLLEQKVEICRLETGIEQTAAIRFYEKVGYQQCKEFGDYQPDPLSLFMEKKLAGRGTKIESRPSLPFYVVAFSSRLREQETGYAEVAAEMVELVQAQPGFLGFTSSRNSDGRGFTASFWQDREAIKEWQGHPRHLLAQKLGREKFYACFKTTFAKVEIKAD